jgi:hypothetical protein
MTSEMARREKWRAEKQRRAQEEDEEATAG